MHRFATASCLLILAGCSMNPRLDHPAPPVAALYPGAAFPLDTGNGADTDWRAMFGDPRLQRLIALALTDSRDLRIAVMNAEALRAQYQVERAGQSPAIGASAGYARQHMPSGVATASVGGVTDDPGETGVTFGQFTAQSVLTSFEIDLFGRLRSQSQAAFARYQASEEGCRATRITLVGAVVDAYLAERLAQEQMDLTEATLRDWRASFDIARRLHAAAQNSALDVTLAEGQVRQAEADLEARRRALAQASNALTLAVGAPLPADLPPPIALMGQPIPTSIPAGLPADLLERRPDIRQAERELVAANADIGAARAAFFPRLSLTGAFGFTSLALDGLFNSGNRAWSFSPQISQPIFQGGQLRGSLWLADLRKSIAVATYERAIQSAFREVADGLAARATFDRQIAAQAATAATAQRRLDLSLLRYRAGLDGRLDLLDAQRSTYAAHQALLDLKREQFSAVAALYRALGGGLEPGPGGRRALTELK